MDPDEDLADFLDELDDELIHTGDISEALLPAAVDEALLALPAAVPAVEVVALTYVEAEYQGRLVRAQRRRVLQRREVEPTATEPTSRQLREMRILSPTNQPGRKEQEGGRTGLFKIPLGVQEKMHLEFVATQRELRMTQMALLAPEIQREQDEMRDLRALVDGDGLGALRELEAPAIEAPEEIIILPDEEHDIPCYLCSDDVVATCSSCLKGMCKDCIPNYATNGSLCPNCRAFDKVSSASRKIPEETRLLMRSNRADFEMSEFLRLAGLTSFVCPPCGTAVHLTEVELSLESGQFVECARCAAKSCKKCKKVHEGRCRISLEERQTAAHLEVYSRTCEHCGESCTRTEPGHSDAACASTLHYCTRAPGGCVVFCIAGTCRHSYTTADPEAIHSRFAHMCTCQTLGFRHDGTLNSDFKCPICNKCRLYPSADAWDLLLALAMQRGYVKDGEEVPESMLADIARLTLAVIRTREEAQAALDSEDEINLAARLERLQGEAAARQEAEQEQHWQALREAVARQEAEQEQHWQALRRERRLRREPAPPYVRAREADRQEHGRRVLAIAWASRDITETAAAVFAEPLVRPDPFEALMLSLGRPAEREESVAAVALVREYVSRAPVLAEPEAAHFTPAQIATMARRAAAMRAHQEPLTEEQLLLTEEQLRQQAEDEEYEANLAAMMRGREVQLTERRRLAALAAEAAAPLTGTSPLYTSSPSYSPFSSDEERAAHEAHLVRAAPPAVHDEVDMSDSEEERSVRRRL